MQSQPSETSSVTDSLAERSPLLAALYRSLSHRCIASESGVSTMREYFAPVLLVQVLLVTTLCQYLESVPLCRALHRNVIPTLLKHCTFYTGLPFLVYKADAIDIIMPANTFQNSLPPVQQRARITRHACVQGSEAICILTLRTVHNHLGWPLVLIHEG